MTKEDLVPSHAAGLILRAPTAPSFLLILLIFGRYSIVSQQYRQCYIKKELIITDWGENSLLVKRSTLSLVLLDA